jgi:oligoribonuclease NrnB/cAMP/cGMP phosphodiesterase (DHH superfamily)
MKVFYHSDNDGKCAGFWVKELATPDEKYDTEFIKMDYNIDFPFETIKPNETVYIVDYSISTEEMDKLFNITTNIIWIDHHKSAIERYENYDKEIKGLRYDGIAGCMLTYCYLKHMTDRGNGEVKSFSSEMTEDAPEFTKLIADYDVWTFEYGDKTRAFEKGFTLFLHEPEDEIWDDLLTESDLFNNTTLTLSNIISSGKTIIEYRKNMMRDYCEKKGFEAVLDGNKCFAVNMAMMGTDDFIIPNVEDYDILISFSFDGMNWNYSLRSTKIDCAELAMKYGGGGHKGAAGFSQKEFILEV